MNATLEIIIRAVIAEIPQLNEELEQFLSANSLGMNDILDIQLAVEEAVTNTIKHGYHGKEGIIRIHASVTGDLAKIIIRDSATPFNPLLLPPPDITAPAEDRPIGGLGVMLIRNLMDEVGYGFRNGENVLMLIRRKRPDEPEPAENPEA